jgi:hypothetical protein
MVRLAMMAMDAPQTIHVRLGRARLGLRPFVPLPISATSRVFAIHQQGNAPTLKLLRARPVMTATLVRSLIVVSAALALGRIR